MESHQTHLTSVMSEASIRAKTADLGLSAMETQPSQRHWSTRPKHSYVSMKLASTLLLSILLSEQCHHFVNPRLPEKSFYFAHRNMLPAPNTAWKTRCYCAHGAWRFSPAEGSFIFSHPRNNPCPNATPPPGAINLQAQILRLHQFSQGQNPSSFHARWLPDRMLARIPQYLPLANLKTPNHKPTWISSRFKLPDHCPGSENQAPSIHATSAREDPNSSHHFQKWIWTQKSWTAIWSPGGWDGDYWGATCVRLSGPLGQALSLKLRKWPHHHWNLYFDPSLATTNAGQCGPS